MSPGPVVQSCRPVTGAKFGRQLNPLNPLTIQPNLEIRLVDLPQGFDRFGLETMTPINFGLHQNRLAKLDALTPMLASPLLQFLANKIQLSMHAMDLDRNEWAVPSQFGKSFASLQSPGC